MQGKLEFQFKDGRILFINYEIENSRESGFCWDILSCTDYDGNKYEPISKEEDLILEQILEDINENAS